jgi:hypothetical protein
LRNQGRAVRLGQTAEKVADRRFVHVRHDDSPESPQPLWHWQAERVTRLANKHQ